MAASTWCLHALVLVLLAGAAHAQIVDHSGLHALKYGRTLLEADTSTLEDLTFAFLTKFEENFNISNFATSPKSYALWAWSKTQKSIKYAVVAASNASEALSAATLDDIAAIHLHVNGTRGTNSTAKLGLMKGSGAVPTMGGLKVYSQGSINDSMVSNWTNPLGIKTAKDLWDQYVLKGLTYTNIHTTKYPDGEARGQNDWLYEDLETVEDSLPEEVRTDNANWRMAFMTTYEGTASPAGPRTARGMASVGVKDNTLYYNVASGPAVSDALYMVTTPKDVLGVDLGVGAMRGAKAPFMVNLTMPNVNGPFTVLNGLKFYAKGSLTDAQLTNMTANSSPAMSVKDLWAKVTAGQVYVCVRTDDNPMGELRGQLDWDYTAMDELKDMITATTKTGSKNAAAAWKLAAASLLLAAAGIFLLV